jgi:hypothetical protein
MLGKVIMLLNKRIMKFIAKIEKSFMFPLYSLSLYLKYKRINKKTNGINKIIGAK